MFQSLLNQGFDRDFIYGCISRCCYGTCTGIRFNPFLIRASIATANQHSYSHKGVKVCAWS